VKLYELILTFISSLVIALTIGLVVASCNKEVRYTRHSEPCNSDKYDCIDIEAIK
jgi:hypothetical protein